MPNYKTINGYTFNYHPRKIAPWYNKFGATELNQVYGRFSNAKSAAMRYCQGMCHDLGGFDFAITSHNCQGFALRSNLVTRKLGNLCKLISHRDINTCTICKHVSTPHKPGIPCTIRLYQNMEV